MTRPATPAVPKARGAREKVLRTACELFYEQGIRAVGVDTIVEQAGVAKTSLYRWFPTKDDLVVAFLEWRDQLFWEQWDQVAAKHQQQPRREMLAQLRWINAYIGSAAYRGCPFIKASGEFFDEDHPVRVVIRQHKECLRERLVRLAQDAGAPAPALLADQLTLLIDGAFASSRATGAGGPARGLVQAGETLIGVALGTS
jgi:AcrR family transcriptional regulator